LQRNPSLSISGIFKFKGRKGKKKEEKEKLLKQLNIPRVNLVA
jgi:hypothetical protein